VRKPSFLLLVPALAFFNHTVSGAPFNIVELQTTQGTVTLQLDHGKAPISSKNFIDYAQSGFYKNTLIHRVIKGFVAQGGGFDKATGLQKQTHAPIINEASNGLSNVRGTIAMARLSNSSDPKDPQGANTATSQFFINLADKNKTFLDYQVNKNNPAGYAVFGKVIKGMAVVDGISNLANFNDNAYNALSEVISIDNVYLSAALNDALAVTRITVIGQGKVISKPAGIACGSACTKSQARGAALKLTATPAKGFYFNGWRGDCQGFASTININTKKGNHNCTALFYKVGATTQ